GDAIQFLRYVPLFRARHRRVTVQAPRHLLPLLERMRGIDDAIPLEYPLQSTGHDCELECSDLPYLFRTTIGNIPAETRLSIPSDARFTGGGLKVGLAWAAGAWNQSRSIPFELLAQLAGIRGVQLFSLQRGPEGL